MANLIKVWDLSTRKLIREFPLQNAKANTGWSGFTVSPDGKWIALQRGGDPVEIFDATTGAVVATLPRLMGPYESAFLPDREVYLTPSNIARPVKTGNSLEVVAYDLKKQKVVATFRGHEKGWLEVAVSADGKVLAVGNEEGNVLIWDIGQLN